MVWMNDFRSAEILINDEWLPIEFKNIKKGDTFRLFESTGEPVLSKDGDTEFIAISNPYIAKGGVDGIDIKGGDED